jgi:hypothetical protein
MIVKKLSILCAFLCVTVILGCIDSGTKGPSLNKDSERTDGSREITVYKSTDNKIRATTVKNTNPIGFSTWDLTNEAKHVVPNLDKSQLNQPLPEQKIDGHMAISGGYEIWSVSAKSGIKTKNIPDLYVTVIGYPERNLVLTIFSNGDNANWSTHNAIVNEYKL